MGQEPKLSISSPRMAFLEQILAEQPAGSIRCILAKAELAALSGQLATAASSLREIATRSWTELQGSHTLLASALSVAIAALDLDTAALMVNRKCETGDWFGLGVEDNRHPYVNVIRWEIRDQAHCRIWFDSKLLQSSAMEAVIIRFVSALPLLASYRTYEGFSSGDLFVNLGDIGYVPGLAFCGSRPEYFLVPDALFVLNRGYETMRQIATDQAVLWQERLPIGYWRGGTSGHPTDRARGWRALPRVQLCTIGQEHPKLIDAGITHVVQMPDARSEQEISRIRLNAPLRPSQRVPTLQVPDRYRWEYELLARPVSEAADRQPGAQGCFAEGIPAVGTMTASSPGSISFR